jgi:glycosyltransferase involved in cell wall biosynthesis
VSDIPQLQEQLSVSLIICTKDRKEILWQTLDSVFQGSCLPDEIIIVDDGALPQDELELTIKPHVERFQYIKKDTPGLTISRNLGVEHASGDIVFFLDDDVILDRLYLEKIKEVFAQDKEEKIAGVTGTLKFHYKPGVIPFLRFFCMDGVIPGRILPSGFGVLVRDGDIHQVIDVQWLAGCNMAYRQQVFKEYKFDQSLGRYAWGEDKDFSFRLSKKHRLVATPNALLTHLKTPSGRIDRVELGYMEIVNPYNFVRKNLHPKFYHWLALYWAFLGIFLMNIINLLSSNQSRSLGQLAGNLHGFMAILTRRVITP